MLLEADRAAEPLSAFGASRELQRACATTELAARSCDSGLRWRSIDGSPPRRSPTTRATCRLVSAARRAARANARAERRRRLGAPSLLEQRAADARSRAARAPAASSVWSTTSRCAWLPPKRAERCAQRRESSCRVEVARRRTRAGRASAARRSRARPAVPAAAAFGGGDAHAATQSRARASSPVPSSAIVACASLKSRVAGARVVEAPAGDERLPARADVARRAGAAARAATRRRRAAR